ncbi:hypothetical protein [Pelagibacterium sediminicola]|uniref:hypothetical protein n=1 Tax=Pelagibacterium sediminicola TaxID=2248761 RepID=UPI000E31FB1B|nr:hypothetical protein [Pelagibacterium sediminicola]
MNRHDDIPEDVSATARASASKCRSAIFHLTEKSAGVWAEGGVIEAMNEAFARAILAERQRCADIAETAAINDEGEYWIAARIAEGIRTGVEVQP